MIALQLPATQRHDGIGLFLVLDAFGGCRHLEAVGHRANQGRRALTDAHQHVWIEPGVVPGDGLPLLNDRPLAEAGLAAYRAAGGAALLDCQPGGCGRNAVTLAELSKVSGVAIIASS